MKRTRKATITRTAVEGTALEAELRRATGVELGGPAVVNAGIDTEKVGDVLVKAGGVNAGSDSLVKTATVGTLMAMLEKVRAGTETSDVKASDVKTSGTLFDGAGEPPPPLEHRKVVLSQVVPGWQQPVPQTTSAAVHWMSHLPPVRQATPTGQQ